jgi:putative flippase GtrA
MTTAVRFARFNIVGALGIGVQLAVVALLSAWTNVGPTAASAVAVAVALLHNFAWHVGWTWRDRHLRGRTAALAFARFAGVNGVLSLAGTAAMIPALTGPAHLSPVAANVVTIAICGVLNFVLADRLGFRDQPLVSHEGVKQ